MSPNVQNSELVKSPTKANTDLHNGDVKLYYFQ